MTLESKITLLNKICIIIIITCLLATGFIITCVVIAASVSAEIIDDTKDFVDNSLMIPLPEGVKLEDVEWNADLNTVNICIPTVDEKFYYNNSLSGDSTHIKKLEFGVHSGTSVFKLSLNQNCECELTDEENGGLLLSLVPIKEKYSMIFAIDPTHGGEDTGSISYGVKESEINLSIANSLALKLKEAGYFAYLIRDTDEGLNDNERQEIVKALDPDLVIRISCNASKNTRILRGMEVSFLAPKDSGAAEGMKDIDLKDSGDIINVFLDNGIDAREHETKPDSLYGGVSELCIYAGYLTNKADAQSLCDTTYIDSICSALVKGF